MKHYKEKLSEFVNHELAQNERQAIGEHLFLCGECRAEHDEIKLGATLANKINQHDAPENLWYKIENALDKKERKPLPFFAFFASRSFAAMFVLLLICGSFAVIYFGFLRNISNESVTNQTSNITSQETLSAQNILPSWNVEILSGTPKIGEVFGSEKLTVGEILETDENSRARVQVANIGNIEIAPNSRVKLVKTKSTEHRLSLEKGLMKAKINAPPRLFIVDTPSAVAVDLGCEYTLDVDKNGNSKLHVTSGFVALEKGKFVSIVPAGAMALTKKGKGIGTPFAAGSSVEFQKSLYRFDFENGGNAALETIFKEANSDDSLTLWHLLSRVPKAERRRVFNALASFVKPPADVTVDGILRLDNKMLEAWWKEVENVWFS